jgi:hydroxypyruvate reductase
VSSAGPRDFLASLFREAVATADPSLCVPPHLPAVAAGRTLVVGAGKASAAMAKAVEGHWPGDLSGLVITRYGHGVPCRRIEIVEAAHPVPDAAGLRAAQRVAEMVGDLSPEDLVICLISGGGSALLSAPADGLTLEHKREVNRQLLASGAPISEMNCLRKHLSSLKGGRLAAAAFPARVVSLIISDVVGDHIEVIGSGPTAPDPLPRARDDRDLAVQPSHHFPLRSAHRRTRRLPGERRASRGSVRSATWERAIRPWSRSWRLSRRGSTTPGSRSRTSSASPASAPIPTAPPTSATAPTPPPPTSRRAASSRSARPPWRAARRP